MMKIKFKLNSEDEVQIIGIDEKTNKEHQIGQIFTPGGTGHYVKNGIQICGFTEAFDLWGCGIFGDAEGRPVKDIQLKFDIETKVLDKSYENKHIDFSLDGCCKCYNKPCCCEIKTAYENPFTVKRTQDLYLEKIKEATKPKDTSKKK